MTLEATAVQCQMTHARAQTKKLGLFLNALGPYINFCFRMVSKAASYISRTSIGAYFHSARESRKLVLIIVAIALLLDNMLLTTVGRYNTSFCTSYVSRASLASCVSLLSLLFIFLLILIFLLF